MLLTALAASPAQAVDSVVFVNCGTTATYKITTVGSAVEVSNGASCVGAVVIPEGVTSIGAFAFYEATALTSITIPASVKTIGNFAFARATLLKTVTFAEGSLLESIGDGAFERATSLTSITIPASVKTIGEIAFIFATDLTSITIPASVESIGRNAFQAATSLESINFTDTLDDPALLTSIGYGAFFGSAKLTSITIPASVKTIGEGAFGEAFLLETVTFAKGSLLESIGVGAFESATSLTSITIPASVKSIGTKAFAKAYNLSRIYFLGHAPTVGVNAFPGSATAYITPGGAGFPMGIEWNLLAVMVEKTFVCSTGEIKTSQTPPGTPTYTITDGVVSAGASCVGAVVIPEGVTKIQADAFNDALALTSITIPASATSIGDYAFVNTDKLTSVTFAGTSPSPSLTIGEYAFAGTPLLASITIPERVTSIGVRAFYATALTSVTFSGTSLEPQMTIGERAFEEAYSLTSITIPKRVSDIGESAFRNTASLSAITVDVDNEQYTSTDGVLFNKLSQTLIAYPASKTGTSYLIPGSVSSIQDFAFAGATLLTSITVDVNSAQFTSTGGVLFNKLSTTVISYPSGRIGSPYSVPESVTTIGTGAFAGASAITSITIPDGVSNIGYAAFHSASALTSITIPASVASIGDFAFWGATALSSIYFLGSAPAADPVGTRAFRNIGASPKAFVKNANVNSFTLVDGKWNELTVEIVDPPVVPPVVPPADNTPQVDLIAQAAAADLATRTVKAKSKFAIMSLAKRIGVKTVSPKAKVTFSVSKASKKICAKSGSSLKTLKAGKCVVTFTVQEPTPKKAKKPKATKTVKTLVVQ
jgi:hypothetical protein